AGGQDRAAAADVAGAAHGLRGSGPAVPGRPVGVHHRARAVEVPQGAVDNAGEHGGAVRVRGEGRDRLERLVAAGRVATAGHQPRPCRVLVTSETPWAPALNAVPKLVPLATTMYRPIRVNAYLPYCFTVGVLSRMERGDGARALHRGGAVGGGPVGAPVGAQVGDLEVRVGLVAGAGPARRAAA